MLEVEFYNYRCILSMQRRPLLGISKLKPIHHQLKAKCFNHIFPRPKCIKQSTIGIFLQNGTLKTISIVCGHVDYYRCVGVSYLLAYPVSAQTLNRVEQAEQTQLMPECGNNGEPFQLNSKLWRSRISLLLTTHTHTHGRMITQAESRLPENRHGQNSPDRWRYHNFWTEETQAHAPKHVWVSLSGHVACASVAQASTTAQTCTLFQNPKPHSTDLYPR